jgi:hypothetical protein
MDNDNMKNANNREEKVSFSLAKKRMVAVKVPIIVVTKTTEKKISTVGCMQVWYQWFRLQRGLYGKSRLFQIG